MSTNNTHSSNINGTTKWVVGAVLSALLAISAVVAARTYDGANVALAIAPVVQENSQDIKALKEAILESRIQNGIINNKLDSVLDKVRELKKK